MPPDTLTLEVISPNIIEVWGGVDIGPPGPAGTTDHLLLLNVGTNTHDDIDTHIADTNNPHATTADQILPSQTGNDGKYLTTDGTTSSWGTVSGGGGGGGGVTDHGDLTGLSDDDHSQYHTDARGDARYSALGHTHAYDPAGTASAAVTAHEGAVDPHPTYLTATEGNAAYSALGHNHAGVYDLAGTASAAVTAHEGASDPHPTYLTATEGNAAYSALGHNHSGVYDPAGTASAAITAHESAVDPHPTYLTSTEGNATYAALGHAHSGVYDPAGTASAAVTAHEGASDPHPTYLTAAEGNAAYAALGHTHAYTAADIANVAAGNIASTNVQTALNELDDEKGPYSSGFVNRTDTTLAFDAGTRVFTLTKVNNFSVYAGGKKYDYTASQTTTIANSTGLHFIYIDTDGVLKNGTSVWDIGAGAQAPVATIYYNTSGPAAIGPFDERHSYLRNAQAHAILHNTVGAYWQSGYAGTFGDTNGSISITAGTYYDEDISHVSSGTLTQAKAVYRSSSAWVADALSSDIRKTSGGILQYDNGGTLASVTSNNYANYWVFAVNTPTPEIHVVVGQTLFTSTATATAESVTALTLPPWITAEGKLLYRITYQRTAGTPAGDIFQTPTDFRTIRLTGGSTTGNVTNGDAHDHSGGDGAQIDHTTLSNIGTNTHAQIDTHLASTSNPHSVTADQVLPSQTSNSGKYLTTNGTTASWGTVSGGLPSQTGNSGKYLTTNGTDPSWSTVTASADWIYASKTTTYTVVAGDKAYWLDCTNTFTLTFSAPATLGANWYCIVKNAGTGIITLSHTSGNIDGLTSYLIYPGDTRFVQCDGSTLRTVLLAGGKYTWTSGVSTFTVPSNIVGLSYEIYGAGGGGASGRRGSASTNRLGGAGGGGGAANCGEYFPVPAGNTSLTVEVGAGGSGGASRSVNSTSGAVGGVGGTSQFGTAYAYGGGGGGIGGSAATVGGSGGGISSAGVNGGTSATAGGGPSGGTTSIADAVSAYGGAGAPLAAVGGRGQFGGASGAPSNASSAYAGGRSIYGGPGGGAGGAITSADAIVAASTGGSAGWDSGTGAAAGGTGANGTAGSGREGGGGGGASTTGNAGAGGAGGTPAGGGGGGGASLNDTGNSGAGGAGGNGQVTVWYY